MGLVKKALWLNVPLFLAFLFLESYHALPSRGGNGVKQESQVVKRPPVERPPSVRPKTFQGHKSQDPIGDQKVYPQAKSVTVHCQDAWMEIYVKADLYNTGVIIDGNDLRLGGDGAPECGARQSTAIEYIIVAGLSDCGTKRLVTDDALVYTNQLVYSPATPEDGVIRMEGVVLPIECHYERRYGVSSSILNPTWVPFATTLSAEDVLGFSLRLMDGDWLHEKTSAFYFLSDEIYIEAAVTLAYHMPLRVFVDSCVATLFPDKNSEPSYSLIENGCFTDARRTGSNSQFLPRVQDDKLHIQLKAFRFHQETRNALYITCHVKAVPVVHNADPTNRACSFIDGSWRSVDGNDRICDSCDESKPREQPVQSGHHGDVSLPPVKVLPRGHSHLAPRFPPLESSPVEPTASVMIDHKELEGKTTPSLWDFPQKPGNGPLGPLKKDEGHLGEPLVKEEEIIEVSAITDEEEGSGMMDTENVDRKDQENEATPSPMVHPRGPDASPKIFPNGEPVGSAVPSTDSTAAVPEATASNDSASPTDLASKDTNPALPSDEPTLDTALPLGWEEDAKASADEGDSSLIQ